MGHWPDDPEYQRILRDHLMWSEYTAGFDLRDLPAWEYQAHAALISGIRERESKPPETPGGGYKRHIQ